MTQDGSPVHFRLRTTALVGGFLGFFVSGGIASLYGPMAPVTRRLFGVDEFTSGLPASVHPLVAVLGVLAWVWLSRRVRPGILLGSGAVLLGLGAGGVAWAPGMGALLSWVVVIGVGFGVLANGMNAVYPRDTGPRSATIVGAMHGCFGAGAVLLPLLMSVSGHRVAYLSMTLLGVVAVPLMWGTPAPPTVGPGAASRTGRGPLFIFALLFGFYVGVEAATATWLATYLEHVGWSEAAGARWTSAFWLLFAAGRFLFAPVAGWIPPGRVVRYLLPGAAVLLFAANVPVLAPFALVGAGLCLAPVFPTAMIWLPRVLPAARGATTLAVLAAMAGATVAPAAVGALGSWLGLQVIPSALAAIAVVASLIAVRAGSRVGQG